jgi:hypothetical protein
VASAAGPHFRFSGHDRGVVGSRAGRNGGLASRPEQAGTIGKPKRHDRLRPGRPMLFVGKADRGKRVPGVKIVEKQA